MAILLMLSACAQHGPGDHPTVSHDPADERRDIERQNVDSSEASVRNVRYHREHKGHHHHHVPTAEEEYAATVALLISAQIFACAFVVVILDGHCNFIVGTGYYY